MGADRKRKGEKPSDVLLSYRLYTLSVYDLTVTLALSV